MQPDTLQPTQPAQAAMVGCSTVFAALGHFGAPSPANRFADFDREVLFAM